MGLFVNLELSEGGFLLNPSDWSTDVAEFLAVRSGIDLTDAHWEILRFIRGYYANYNHLPNARMFVKAVQKELGIEKGDSIYLHALFPDGPLRYACLIAGLPKPPGCL